MGAKHLRNPKPEYQTNADPEEFDPILSILAKF